MINKVILLGNVGADPEVRTFEDGTKVARIRIATTEKIYNPKTQERTEKTEWHSVTLWRGLAGIAEQYIRKGGQVYVEGKIRNTEWTDANGGKRFGVEILADDLKLLGRRDSGATQGGYNQPSSQSSQQNTYNNPLQQPAAQENAYPNTASEEFDDLPF